MRTALMTCALLAASCGPKATVQRTTPLANLQSYRAIAVRVAAQDGSAQMQVGALGMATAAELQRSCNFEQVYFGRQAEGAQVDLVLDLNIQRSFRGGEGLLQNDNLATIEVLAVLSDGINGDLVGTAQIKGQSSAVMLSGSRSPEQQAVDVVAETIAGMLGKSGCTGARIARAPDEPPPDTTAGGDAGAAGSPEQDKIAEAEKLNDQGKERFRAADINGAMELFRQAIALHPDPRYSFNMALGYEALGQFDKAIATCNEVLGMNPPDSLGDKVRARIDIIQQKKSGK